MCAVVRKREPGPPLFTPPIYVWSLPCLYNSTELRTKSSQVPGKEEAMPSNIKSVHLCLSCHATAHMPGSRVRSRRGRRPLKSPSPRQPLPIFIKRSSQAAGYTAPELFCPQHTHILHHWENMYKRAQIREESQNNIKICCKPRMASMKRSRG